MKENNKKEKDNIQITNRITNQNFNSSIISPKKVITKNYIRNKKGDFLAQKKPNILLKENNSHNNTKFVNNSPDLKSKPNDANNLKSLQKNLVNNQNQIKIQKQKKFQKSSNNNSSMNNPIVLNTKEEKSIEKEQKRKTPNKKNKIIVNPKRVINDNQNQNKIEMNNSTNVSHSLKSKKIKINTIKNSKNNINILIDDKTKKKSRGSMKNENYIDNFTLGELDENIEKNIHNSRKHYSLTNPNILPCIPFSNPFSNKGNSNINNNSNNNNINITETNEKNEINKNNKNNNNNKKEVLENNFFSENSKFNIIDDNKEENEPEEEDVKLNISNLEIDIEQMNEETNKESKQKNEIPVKNIQKNYKSFIQFNNNLSFKLAVEKSKNTPSYILALCPNLFRGINKKKIIKENYAVNDAISEEMDSDTLTPKNSKNKNSFDEKNTKYSTKEKNSDRNKKPQEFESEDGSYDDKKNLYNNSNSERKYKGIQNNNSNSIINIYKNVGSIKKSKNSEYEKIIINNENNFDDNTKTIVIKKREKKKKRLNIKDINIETQNINNINNISINKDVKNSPLKINYYYTSPNKSNTSLHRSNNTINNIVYNETENNDYNYNKLRAKILKIKNSENKEKHQKAKSLISNINLSTLYLYETIQNNNITNNNIIINKKQKLFKNNIKSTDYRNKILNKEKKVIEKENNAANDNNNFNKKKSNEKYLFNNNNRTNSYKNEDKNTNNGYNSNLTNKKKLKKIAFSHLLKSPKYKVNPFLSNFSNNNENKSINCANNNNILYTFHNTENKYSNYYELYKKRNNNYKLANNNNTINAINNNELNNNFTNEINVNHCKQISQQFIDEYNFLLETKNDNNQNNNNNTIIKNKNKVLFNFDTLNNNNNINKKNSLNKYFSYNKNQKVTDNKEASDINNKSVKFKNKANYENSSIKKISHITPCHKKSRTFFISPSYVIKNISNMNKNINQNDNEKIINMKEKVKIKENKNNFNTTAQSKNNIKPKSNYKSKIINLGNKKNSINKYSKINEKTDTKINNNDNNNKNKFTEIKKIIGETSLTKIIHKKTNTIGSTNILSNFLNNNFLNYNNLIKNTNNNIYNNMNNSNSTRNNSTTMNSRQLKRAASINNLINNSGNKKKIINAMQRIKFIPVSYYSKAIKELIKSQNNFFVLSVFKDENQKYVFRGLYEINEKDPKIAIKLFASNYGQNNININNINYFYNYSLSKGDFIRYKFIDEKNKNFNEDTVIIL